ncbi:unnamed protein product [Rotaria socialis]|uniref:Uncharacterized protein n=1 Tax=Rotaria socialis TaxID=392032 RepID=A0A820GXW1_9BILA|nr:unnamed protein product [Rotaria socialis]
MNNTSSSISSALMAAPYQLNIWFGIFLWVTVYRQWSNRIPLAYKVCMVCALIWLLFIGHRLILYKAKNGKCAPRSEFYAYFDNYIEIALTAICPPVVMIVRAY